MHGLYVDVRWVIHPLLLGVASGLLFFRTRFASFILHYLLFVFCFFVLFHSCCSHARVFRKSLVFEFRIFYSHTEWYLFFSRGEIVLPLTEASPIKNESTKLTRTRPMGHVV